MNPNATKCSASDVLEFVGTAINKGWYKRATGMAIKSACELLFKILDETELDDVSALDLESALHRYANLNTSTSANTLRTYKTRVKTAIRDCVERSANPTRWKPGNQARAKSSVEGGPSPGRTKESKPAARSRRKAPVEQDIVPRHRQTYSGLQYSFPLRDDWVLRLENVPMDLTAREVERVAVFLKALVRDASPENPSLSTADTE